MRIPRHRAALLPALVGLLTLLGLVVAPAPGASAASAGWADVTFDGSANDWSGTLRQRATGFPAATITSDSAGGSAVGRQSGSSTYLSTSTPVGDVYGSSKGRPYLNLRPYTANGSGVPGTSTTTYAFDAPTPAGGWTFVLGDVDADAVTVSATGPGGVPVDPADLGFRSVFNYCGSGTCTANDDVPSWDEAEATLTGNASATDTNGASAWFEPQVPLETLTLVFTRRAGFPVYQTWFAAQAFDLTGTVDAPAEVREGLTVRLFAPDGRVVEETTTDAEGAYRFDRLATYDGYRVALVRPTGYTSDDPLSRTVDLSTSDRVADFSLRAIVPTAVSGTVLLSDGDPVPGVTVTLTGPGGERTVVTGADGAYVIDELAVGEGYTLTATPPPGTTTSGPRTFAVPPDSEEPVEGQDFTITPQPTGTLGGTVRVEDGGTASGVRVVVTGPDGVKRVAVTDGDGRWSVDDLPPGDYTATVEPPDGATVVGDATLRATVPADGGTVRGLDFVLDAPAPPATFSASGTVVDEAGMAFRGVDVTVVDPDGEPYATVTTGEDGTWQVDDLLAGEGWTATVEPPEGYEAQDGDSLAFDVTDADTTGLDFVLVRETSTGGGGGTEPVSGGSGGGSGGSSSPALAQTGGPDLALLLLGLGATAGAVVLLRRPSTRRE
ncbi:Cna protein B-type domain-containing protein [Microlunatus sagamiharensis]|uniref:alpha-amylase n=1 Tax=Microlunatus sagamiharensis TaxID=546874 RepID=A0A1H2N9G8_9ACTN|nr:carboxypeptidase regulatory-like domain-containing protein [Microlunatus sagamiharensis]SDV01974.1 Cna protein B-type domain-containing protein [Microlunatus sagamiharensis]